MNSLNMYKPSVWLFLPLFTLAHLAGLAQQKKTSKPNIIFIITDDLGYGDLGAFYQQQRAKAGNRSEPWMYTPHLDTLAAQGAMLTQHYAASPVCAPSRASLLLGVSQGHSNVRDNQFDKELAYNHTLATVLHTLGYNTAAIGKWGLQGDERWNRGGKNWFGHPLNRGFDYFLGYMRHVDGHEHYPKEGLYRGSKQVFQNRTNIAAQLDKCYTADLWTAAAKKWIVDHMKGKDAANPFFMYLAYDTPHATLELATQAYPAGGGLKGGIQWLDTPGHMINTASGTPDSWVHPDYAQATYDNDSNAATPEVPWPDVYKRYASSVRRIDDGVGDLMQLLHDLRIDSNTVVVFTSDNGPSIESYLPGSFAPNHPDFFNSFGPFDGIKRDCWEGGMREPAIACWPGHIPAHRIVETPSISYDWMATFTGIVGYPAPARTDGVSLLPSLTGKGVQRPSLIYTEYFHNGVTPGFPEFDTTRHNRKRNQMQMIRQGALVGVRYNVQSADDDFEIYNVVKDPGERHNLAPSMDSLQQALKRRVLQVRRPDTSAKRPYDNALVPSVPERKTQPGVHWTAYAGHFDWVPQVDGLKPAASGNSQNFNLAKLTPGRAAVLYTGYLKVPADGEYTFYYHANASSVLRMHDAVVIDADYNYRGEEREGKIWLQAGLHPFQLCFRPNSYVVGNLQLQWEGPGITRQDIPTSIFCRD